MYNKNNESPEDFILRLKSLKKALSNDVPTGLSNENVTQLELESQEKISLTDEPEIEHRYSITPETQLDLFGKFKSGEITEDEYRRIISSERVLTIPPSFCCAKRRSL